MPQITQQQLDKEIAQAEVDLIVTLEEEHRKNPSLSLEQLCATSTVRAYVREVLCDLRQLIDMPLRIHSAQGEDTSGEPYYIVEIIRDDGKGRK